MKKFTGLLLLLVSTLLVFGEEADSVKTKKKKELTQEEADRKNEANKKFSKFSKDRFAIDLLGTNWIYNRNGPGFNGLQTRWYSRGINVYFYYDIRIKKSRFSIAPGLGYSATNIYSRHEMVEDSTGISFKPLANPDDYKTNKVTVQYIDIPFEFRIKTNPDKLDQCWKFAIGFKAGLRVDVHTKERIKTATSTKVFVERRFPDFNMFRFGPTLRVGYSSFNIVAYYGVLSVFKKDRGPKANEFSLGISFNGL